MSDERELPKVACSLTAADHAARIAWIEKLNATALNGWRRDSHRIRLRYHLAAAAKAREFVRREKECCPFLRFTTEETEDEFLVIIDAPAELAADADTLFASYTHGRKR